MKRLHNCYAVMVEDGLILSTIQDIPRSQKKNSSRSVLELHATVFLNGRLFFFFLLLLFIYLFLL